MSSNQYLCAYLYLLFSDVSRTGWFAGHRVDQRVHSRTDRLQYDRHAVAVRVRFHSQISRSSAYNMTLNEMNCSCQRFMHRSVFSACPAHPCHRSLSYPNIGGFQSVSATAAPGQTAADALVSLVSTMGNVPLLDCLWSLLGFELNVSLNFLFLHSRESPTFRCPTLM
jgi:hypothetical protein